MSIDKYPNRMSIDQVDNEIDKMLGHNNDQIMNNMEETENLVKKTADLEKQSFVFKIKKSNTIKGRFCEQDWRMILTISGIVGVIVLIMIFLIMMYIYELIIINSGFI